MQPFELSVVGIGGGHLDHLTLNGLALIKDADVIAHDGQLDESIRALCLAAKRSIVQAARLEKDGVDEDCRLLLELIRGGQKVVRLSLDEFSHKKRLDLELKTMCRLGVKQRFVPSLQALHKQAWDLGLPWLSEIVPGNFRVIQSAPGKSDRSYWRDLAERADTLTLDIGLGRLQSFVDRLLLAGADPERPVALVAYHPTQNPICWLTTLEEVDELLPQWKPNGSTIVYIGTWPHTVRDTDANKSFWGSLEAAAEIWLRAQRA